MPESVLHHLNHMALNSQGQTQAHSSLALSVETNGRIDSGSADLSESSDPPSPRSSRDSSWLQVEVCRDFRRETCPREAQCGFAHPDAKVMGRARDGKVTCCYDFLKNRCSRDFCKYYHPPAHIKDRLVNAGRQFGAMMSSVTRYPLVQPGVDPGQCWDGYSVKAVMLAYGPNGDRLPICQDFLVGQCYLACPLVHPGPYLHQNVDQTVTICRNFMRGWCAREEKCRFYHPPPHHYPTQQQPALIYQGMPMVQPQLFPVYFPTSPPPSQPALVIPVGAFPAVSLPLSPVPVTSPFVPLVPVIPGCSVHSPVLGGSVSGAFLPEPVVVPAPWSSIIDSTVTNSD